MKGQFKRRFDRAVCKAWYRRYRRGGTQTPYDVDRELRQRLGLLVITTRRYSDAELLYG